MDVSHMSTAALQMKVNELLRENEKLKKEIQCKNDKVKELEEFLDYNGYDETDIKEFKNDMQEDFQKEYNNTLEGAYSNLRRQINGVEEELSFKEKIKEIDWDFMIPLGCTITMALILIIAALCGQPL